MTTVSPAVTWAPGSLDQAHTVDESIDLTDAAIGKAVLEGAVRRLCSRTGSSTC